MALLEVTNIKKNFGKTEVLKGIDFSLEKGDVLSIIGSSGSGKTTLLRCLNFLEVPDCGTISINGETIFDASKKSKSSDKEIRNKRLHFGLVFQSFNLFPQYNVLDNITLAPILRLKDEKLTNEEKKKRIAEITENARALLAKVDLTEKAKAYPCELSGGQQQRVAIARTLALRPDIILFDEPMSALDVETRLALRKELKKLQKELGITMIYITHDQEEAFSLSDRIMVMDRAVIKRFATPDEILSDPQNEYVKRFVIDNLRLKMSARKKCTDFFEKSGYGVSEGEK